MTVQRYVSNELTHFVGRELHLAEERAERQYELLRDIILSGELGTSDFGIPCNYSRPLSGNETYLPYATCFCDIPPADFHVHMKKYSKFGLAFKKVFIVDHGAMPVFYIPRNSFLGRTLNRETAQQWFDKSHFEYLAIKEYLQKANNSDLQSISPDLTKSRLERLFGFFAVCIFSYCKFYEEGLNDLDDENFYMEREWRLHGKFSFTLSDVSRVIFPQEFARRFRDDVPGYIGQITFA